MFCGSSVMQINNLSYFESIFEDCSISGAGALASVSGYAFATGDSTYTLADANTTAKMLGNGGSMAKGRIKAVAIGDNPIAGVSVFGDGDKVIEKTKVHYFKNKDMVVARGFVIAMS
ncbi:MAG: hypothetical protein Kow00121_65210 [Elainellaceae cyanobacterium]